MNRRMRLSRLPDRVWTVRLLFLLCLVLGWLWLSGERVAAHASFERSDPEPNSVVESSPTVISMRFTEPLEFGFSEAVLLDSEGVELPGYVSIPGEDDQSLQIPIETPLDPGTYSVSWSNLSTVDGHTLIGFFSFTVGSAADVSAVAAPGSSQGGPPLWMRAASRWIVYLAIAPIIACWILWLVVFIPAARSVDGLGSELARRMRTIVAGVFVLALFGNVYALVVQAATLPGGGLAERTWDTLTDTRYGTLWVYRLATLAVAGILLYLVNWTHPARRPVLSLAALIATLVVPLPISMIAHAAALTENRWTAIAFDWAHLTFASIWFGGLVLITGALLPAVLGLERSQRREVYSAVFPRFSATVLVCWGLLAITGSYAAWLQVGSLDALLDTTFGRSLAGKLVLLSIVLILAAANLLVLTRRLGARGDMSTWSRRFSLAVSVEIALTVVVLFLVGRMTASQPARDAVDTVPDGITAELLLDETPATLFIDPGVAGQNEMVLTVKGAPLSDGTEAVMRPSQTEQDLGGREIALNRDSGNIFTLDGSELAVAGEWELEFIVREIGSFSWEGGTAIEIGESSPVATDEPWTLGWPALVGLAIAGAGIGGLAWAWLVAPSRSRGLLVGAGVAALVLGFVLFATAQVDAVETQGIQSNHRTNVSNSGIER